MRLPKAVVVSYLVSFRPFATLVVSPSFSNHSLRCAPGTVRQCGSFVATLTVVFKRTLVLCSMVPAPNLVDEAVVFVLFRTLKYCFELRCSCLVAATRYWESKDSVKPLVLLTWVAWLTSFARITGSPGSLCRDQPHPNALLPPRSLLAS